MIIRSPSSQHSDGKHRADDKIALHKCTFEAIVVAGERDFIVLLNIVV